MQDAPFDSAVFHPESSNKRRTVDLMLAIFLELRMAPEPDSKILDFGCGSGEMVYEFRKKGYTAFGTDVTARSENVEQRLIREQLCSPGEHVFKLIEAAPYRIPFEDGALDYVVSDVVFEHVRDYPQALSEIYRVLKPGGCSLHLFPSRYRFLENHVYVPLASIHQTYPYLLFWAFLGIRNQYQKGQDFRSVARSNHEYLTSRTNYLTGKQIKDSVMAQFGNITFAESTYMKVSPGRVGRIGPLVKFFPFLPSLFSTFARRVIFFQRSPG